MVTLPGSLDSRMSSSPRRIYRIVERSKGVSRIRVFFPEPRGTEHFRLQNLPETLSRARRIFCPGFPMDARYSAPAYAASGTQTHPADMRR